MGRPGCPELAFSTESMARKRMAFTDFSTKAVSVLERDSTAAEADTWWARRAALGFLCGSGEEEEEEVLEESFRPENFGKGEAETR